MGTIFQGLEDSYVQNAAAYNVFMYLMNNYEVRKYLEKNEVTLGELVSHIGKAENWNIIIDDFWSNSDYKAQDDGDIQTMVDAFKEMFFVVIQLGAILAVAVSFFNKLNPFSPKKNKEEKKDTWLLIAKVILACIPAGVIGILFDDKLNEIFYNWQTVAVMLIVYGVFFILREVWNKKKGKESAIKTVTDITFTTAFLIGIAQVLSLIPGTSRSGATILGAMLLGASRIAATEFTFFLAIPVMLGASLVKLLNVLLLRG